jgi:hypothetical protein
MMWAQIFVFSLTIGSYQKELASEDILEKISYLEPLVSEFLEKTGYNDIYRSSEPVEEIFSQVVNGKNYIIKQGNLCIKFYEGVKKNSDIEIVYAKPCKYLT